MKGKCILFENIEGFKHRFALDIQLFAVKRVSDLGISLQSGVANQKLKNLIGELYRQGANCGDGSAMAAASHQVRTGVLVGGRDHIEKIRQRITNLSRILEKEPLSESDRAFANTLMKNMKKSLKGEYEWTQDN